MVKVKLIGVGPLSYVSVDHAESGAYIKLENGEEAEVEFHTKLQVFGSPYNPARCNVQIVLEEAEG
ncbi:unnamed protein product [marine sediment metagenome]|uniref:Uncharacterized protein n=1 Tax=marine sediment metagenome TaxID=412755 RepID=X1SID0_9ZZZZ